MSSESSTYPVLPRPAAVAVGGAVVLAAGIERGARSVAAPLWQLVRRVPGVAEPLDATVAALAQTGAGAVHAGFTIAESLTRQLLRTVVPMALEEIDLTSLVLAHVDLDAIAAEIDLDAIITRLQIVALIQRIVGELDLTKLVLEGVDLDAIAAGLDLDGIVAQVDLDKAIASVDLIGLANEIIDGVNLNEIIRESTGALSTDAVRGVRTRGVDADAAVSGFVDRLLGRAGASDESIGAAAEDR